MSLRIGNSHTPVRSAPSGCPAGNPQLEASATQTASLAWPDLLVPPVEFDHCHLTLRKIGAMVGSRTFEYHTTMLHILCKT